MSKGMNTRNELFVKNLSKGIDKGSSAILAGYSPKTANSYASQLLKKTKIIKALEDMGISDRYIAKTLKSHIDDGLGIKATSDTSLRALDLATRLKGYQTIDHNEANLNQTNIYINELKMLNETELNARLQEVLNDIASLKAK